MCPGNSGLEDLGQREGRALAMWRLKGCPKCKGDVELDRDQWGWYEQCIQCGYLFDLQNVVEEKQWRGDRKITKSSSVPERPKCPSSTTVSQPGNGYPR